MNDVTCARRPVPRAVAPETRKMWLIDLPLFLGAVVAALSGIYFLFLPAGGFQGGRNPWYGVVILFSRATWDDIHAWGGLLMLIAATIHLVVHWPWVARMTRRLLNEVRGERSYLNRFGRLNLAANATVGLAFLAAALSGIVLLFLPAGRQTPGPVFLWSGNTWDMTHTWAGTLTVLAAVAHFVIHWRWVVKVTTNVIRSFWAAVVAGHRVGGETASA